MITWSHLPPLSQLLAHYKALDQRQPDCKSRGLNKQFNLSDLTCSGQISFSKFEKLWFFNSYYFIITMLHSSPTCQLHRHSNDHHDKSHDDHGHHDHHDHPDNDHHDNDHHDKSLPLFFGQTLPASVGHDNLSSSIRADHLCAIREWFFN